MVEIVRNSQNAENVGLADLATIHKFIPESVFTNLPEPLDKIVSGFESRERDIVFLSSIGVLSACLPMVFSTYDRKKYNANLYLFIIAPPASGKGAMNWSKILVDPIHEKIIKESKSKLQEYKRLTDNSGVAKPEMQLKILPGNTSSPKVYHHLQNTNDSLLIFESEADSLSNMLKQDWGDFSDILRKAFHHESASISRATEDRHYEIKNPKLSIVISGTPNQLKPLISSVENGLFSRFMYYYFEDVQGWKDVSPEAQVLDVEDVFKSSARIVSQLYDKLHLRQNPLEIKFPKNQWDLFQTEMSLATDTLIKSGKFDFISVIKRHGLMTFRIAMILTVLRNNQLINDEINDLNCSDEDFARSLDIIKIMIEHSLFVFDMNDKSSVYLPMNERKLLHELPNQFSRAIGANSALKFNIAERTFADVLKRWEAKGIISKEGHGVYKKLKVS
jgi:hypothetical protein